MLSFSCNYALCLSLSVVVWFLSPAISVDRSKFMNCQQSPVCRRYQKFSAFQKDASQNKAHSPSAVALYDVIPESVVLDDNTIPTKSGVALKLRHRVDGLEHNVRIVLTDTGLARFTLEEAGLGNGVVPRYRMTPNDVLADDMLLTLANRSIGLTYFIESDPLTGVPNALSVESTYSGLRINEGCKHLPVTIIPFRITIDYSPFQVRVYAGNKVVQVINGQQLLNFEHLERNRENSPPTASTTTEAMPSELARTAGPETSEQKPVTNPDPVLSLQKAGEQMQQAIRDAVDLDAKDVRNQFFGGHSDPKPRGPMAVGVDIKFLGASALYGYPGHARHLQLPAFDEPYRVWNSDVFEYEVHSPMALYGAVPLLIGLHTSQGTEQHAVSAILWANPSETWMRIVPDSQNTASSGTAAETVSETGALDFVLFIGAASPQDLLTQYHQLTGLPAVPPLFSIGKHQSRWNYMNEKDVRSVDDGFDQAHVPYDVLWLDIEHTHGKQYFTWNQQSFPDPANMISQLARKGRRLVAIVDPHIKKDESYEVYKVLKKSNSLLKTPLAAGDASVPSHSNLADFEGWCWPGTSVYPDFLSPEVRERFSLFYQPGFWPGSGNNLFVWNDMNEPSVFNKAEMTCPRDVLHLHCPSTKRTGCPTGAVDVLQDGREHREVHNVYGLYYHRTSYEALMRRNATQRPFILTRSFFIGTHRYGAVWTGDNAARWDHLELAVPMLLSHALGGISFIGADVGGFLGTPDAELYMRWSQQGAWYPFYRDHAHMDSKRREPWLFDIDTLRRVRQAVETRYRLLPYWYTLFMEYALLGRPVIRPLWWWSSQRKDQSIAFELDVACQTQFQEQQFYLGETFLLRPIVKPMEQMPRDPEMNRPFVDVYLPGSTALWYTYETGCPVPPPTVSHPSLNCPLHRAPVTLDTMPTFVHAGTIIPVKDRVRRASELQLADPFTLHIYPLWDIEKGLITASGKVFLDDGNSYAFRDPKQPAFTYDALHLKGTFSRARSNAAQQTSPFNFQMELTSAPASLYIDPGLQRDAHALTGLGVNLAVEKIVLWSLPAPPTRITAVDNTRATEPSSLEEALTFYVTPMPSCTSPLSRVLYHVEIKKPSHVTLGSHGWRIAVTTA